MLKVLLRIGLCVCSSLVLGCARDGRVVYLLSWDLDRVLRAADGTSWTVTTDLGYEVRVAAGYLTSHTAELIACDRRPGALAWLAFSLMPRPAHATHALALDPSAFHRARIESLTAARTARVVRPVPRAQAYCEAHYLVARAGGTATAMPAEVDMTDRSLYVRGVYGKANGMRTAFEITTTVAHGWRGAVERIDAGPGPIAVHVERRLGTLFDGLDFARVPEREWPRRMLANLIDGTVVRAGRLDGGDA